MKLVNGLVEIVERNVDGNFKTLKNESMYGNNTKK